MKRNTVVEIISSLLILLFAYTALSKLNAFYSFKAVLEKSPLIGQKALVLAWIIPLAELTTVLLLLIPRTRLKGLYVSFILMSIFTIYIGYMLVFTPKLPCSCGGVLKQMSWTQHLLFNIFFTLLSAIGIKLHKKPEEKVYQAKAVYQ